MEWLRTARPLVVAAMLGDEQPGDYAARAESWYPRWRRRLFIALRGQLVKAKFPQNCTTARKLETRMSVRLGRALCAKMSHVLSAASVSTLSTGAAHTQHAVGVERIFFQQAKCAVQLCSVEAGELYAYVQGFKAGPTRLLYNRPTRHRLPPGRALGQ